MKRSFPLLLLLLAGCSNGLSDEQRTEAYNLAILALEDSDQASTIQYQIEELEGRVTALEDRLGNAEIE